MTGRGGCISGDGGASQDLSRCGGHMREDLRQVWGVDTAGTGRRGARSLSVAGHSQRFIRRLSLGICGVFASVRTTASFRLGRAADLCFRTLLRC